MWMSHPDLPASATRVADSAFRRVWQHRGWAEADPPDGDKTEAPEPAGDGGLSHDQPEPAPARKRSKEH